MHINTSDSRTFTCTRQVLVNVQWPVCLTCACRCEESQKIRPVHIFMDISVTGSLSNYMNTSDSQITARLHAHIRCMYTCSDTCVWRVHVIVKRVRTFAHYTFSCTHRSLGSLPNYVNPSDSRISSRLHAHIRCMWTCSDSGVWRVHLNVLWVRQLTNCTFSCTPRSLGSLLNYMNTSYSRITACLHAHIRCM